MKKTIALIFEMIRVVVMMFIILFGYTVLNTFVVEWAGGLQIFGDSWLQNAFFLLQAAGVLILITVLYRNKLQLSGWMLRFQAPIETSLARKLVIGALAAIGLSYAILLGVFLSS